MRHGVRRLARQTTQMRDGVHQAPGPAGLMDPPDLEDPAPLRLMNQEFPFGLMLTFKALLTSPSYAIEGIPFFLRVCIADDVNHIYQFAWHALFGMQEMK